MKDELRKGFTDILQAAGEIGGFVEGINFEKYEKSSLIQRAVERNFQIIGEALTRIRRIDPNIIEEISEHYRIIGFRNILVHGYDVVDERIVWDAIRNHLPVLVKEVKKLIET